MKYCIYCMKEKDEKIDVCPHCGKSQSGYSCEQHILRPGTVLDGRYMVGAVIGEGGFGITYIGYDERLDCRVAIKELYPNAMVNRSISLSNDVNSIRSEETLFGKCRANFHNEAVILARYDSEPGIVSVKDCFSENKTEYIVMEYLDGITLMNYLKRVGRISYDNLICLMFPVMQSLKKIHAEGIIHRDISPDNIMLVGESVKLIDFGAAREYLSNKTMSMVIKHGYAPMEQYNSAPGKQGAWTDVYSICATMYRCLVGKIPPQATDRIPEDSIELPSENGINIAPEFEAALMHGLAVMPSGRIKTVEELMNKLKYGDPEYAAEMKIRGGSDEEKRKSKYLGHNTPTIPDDDDKTVIEPENDEPEDNGGKKKLNTKLIAAVCAGVLLLGGGIFAGVSLSGRESVPSSTAVEESSRAEEKITAAVTAESAVSTTAATTANRTTTAARTTAQTETAAAEVTTAAHEPVTVKLGKKSLSMYIGDTEKLDYELSADGAGLTWESSDSSVVSVSGGTLTAENGGTATVTATTTDGEKASCKVTVKTPYITFNGKTTELFSGDTVFPGYDIEPPEQEVRFSSSDSGVVTTGENTITAMGNPGTATVTVSSIYKGRTYSDTMLVTVKNIALSFTETHRDVYKDALDAAIIFDKSTGKFDYDWGYPGWTLDGATNGDIVWKVVTGPGYMDGARLHVTAPGNVVVRGTITRNGYSASAEYSLNLTLKWEVYYTTGRDGDLVTSPGGGKIGTIPAGTYVEFTETRSNFEDGKTKLYGRTVYNGQSGWLLFGVLT